MKSIRIRSNLSRISNNAYYNRAYDCKKKKEKSVEKFVLNFYVLSFLFYFFSLSKEPFPVDPILRRRESPSARNHRPVFERDKFESLISCTNSYQIWTSLFQKNDSNLFGIVSSTGTGSNGSFPNCVFDSGGIISWARDRIPSRVTTKHVRIYTGIEETVRGDQVYSFFFFFPKKLDRYITIISDN